MIHVICKHSSKQTWTVLSWIPLTWVQFWGLFLFIFGNWQWKQETEKDQLFFSMVNIWVAYRESITMLATQNKNKKKPPALQICLGIKGNKEELYLNSCRSEGKLIKKRILKRALHVPVTDTHTLYNSFPLRMGRTNYYDGTVLPE